MFSQYNHIFKLGNPQKVMKKVGIFQYEFDVYPSPLNLAPITFGDVKKVVKYIRSFNPISFEENESIKSFNLVFMKLYDQIPKVV